MLKQLCFIIFWNFLPISHSGDIHEDKFFCAKSEPSTTRILVLSPYDKYLSVQALSNITGKILPPNSDKIYSFPLTLSGFVKDNERQANQCLTLIELPEIFDNLDMLQVTNQLKKKCFDHVLLVIDTRKRRQEAEKIIMSLYQLLELIYGAKFVKSTKVLFMTRAKVTVKIEQKSRKLLQKLFEKYNFLPPSLLLNSPTDANSKLAPFLRATPNTTMSELGADCYGSDCLETPTGFYSGQIPWIGHPNKIIIPATAKFAEFSCFVANPSQNLTAKSTDANSAEISVKSTRILSGDIKQVKFSVNSPKFGANVSCVSSLAGVQSLNSLEILEAGANSWAEWAEWSKCDGEPQKSRVWRSRSRLSSQGRTQVQERFCRCSDLKDLPRPRYLFTV